MSAWKIHSDVEIYFVTSSIVNWIPVFVDKPFFSIITNSLKYCIDNKDLHIHGYVIMPDHIHLLVNGKGNLSDIMRDFKTYTSVQISTLLKDKGYQHLLNTFQQAAMDSKKSDRFKIWQEEFHPIAIYSEKFYNQKLNYIHQNPVKKGYVTEPKHWYYSSARNYAGVLNRSLEVEML